MHHLNFLIALSIAATFVGRIEAQSADWTKDYPKPSQTVNMSVDISGKITLNGWTVAKATAYTWPKGKKMRPYDIKSKIAADGSFPDIVLTTDYSSTLVNVRIEVTLQKKDEKDKIVKKDGTATTSK